MTDSREIDPLIYTPTPTTPQVVLDVASGRFEIKGRSLPEHAIVFYAPILEWLKTYSTSPAEYTEIHIQLDYFNTPSAKPLLVEICSQVSPLSVLFHKAEPSPPLLKL